MRPYVVTIRVILKLVYGSIDLFKHNLSVRSGPHFTGKFLVLRCCFLPALHYKYDVTYIQLYLGKYSNTIVFIYVQVLLYVKLQENSSFCVSKVL